MTQPSTEEQATKEKQPLPNLGFGLGLRTDHYHEILEAKPKVDWFEALSENYMVPGGKPHYFLDRIRADYPMVMHGVSLSIGSTTKFDQYYLRDLKKLADRIEPAWISDHLCWTGVHGQNMHDLLPLPYTEETVKHIYKTVFGIHKYTHCFDTIRDCRDRSLKMSFRPFIKYKTQIIRL